MQKTWGIIVPTFTSNIEDLIGTLETEAGSRGRKLVHYITYNDPGEEKKLVGKMVKQGFEAVIVVPNSNEILTAGVYRHLNPGRTEVILIDHTMAGSWFKYVIQSYDLGILRAVEYLVARSNRNLLLVQNDTWKGRDLLNVICNARLLSHDFLQENNIGGILYCSDIDSVKVLGRLKKWGMKVPEEVSLVSYGNTELTAFFEPGITVIDPCYEEMASHTAALIAKKDEIIEQYVIQPSLIVRQT